jgi:O-antigen polymerase
MLVISTYCVYNFKADSSHGRELIYLVSWDILKSNYITGIGLNHFQAEYNHFQALYFARFPDSCYKLLADNTFFAFNEYLQVVIELGLFGGLSLLVFFIMILYKILKDRPQEPLYIYGAGASIISISICALFSYSIHIKSIEVIGLLFLALFSKNAKKLVTINVNTHSLSWVLLCIVGTTVCSFIITRTIKSYNASRTWEKAAFLASSGDFKSADLLYKMISPEFENNGKFLFNYGSELSIANNNKKSIDILKSASLTFPNYNLYVYMGQSYEHLGNTLAAEDCYKYSTNMIPSRFLSKYLLLKLLVSSNQHLRAKQLAKAILKAPIKVPSEEVRRIKEYANLVHGN